MRPPVDTQPALAPADLLIPVYSLLPHLDELVFVLKGEGAVRDVSPSACALLRADPDMIRGRPSASWLREEDNLREILGEALSGTAPAYSQLTLLPVQADSIPTVACAQRIRSGDETLVLLILKPVEAWDREPQLAAEIHRMERRLVELQISLGETARKLSEKTVQLAVERNKTLAVISNMAAGVVAIDGEGKVTQANQRAEELLGIPEGQLHSRSFGEAAPALAETLADPEFGDECSPVRARLSAGGKTLQVDSTPIRDTEGKASGWVVVIHDRTAEEDLNRMREELVSVVSHEMRGPLTTLGGYVNLILRGEAGPVEPGVTEILGIVEQNARRLTALVNDLLDLSQLESGTVALARRPLTVAPLLYCIYCDLEPQAEERGVGLQIDAPERPVRLLGDEGRLLQVLSNLGSNALKFTPSGGEVVLWAGIAGESVVLGVSDTGIGIAPEDQQRLFTRFFRSREAKERGVPGTGLGLCITRKIVQAHGGRIEIDSSPGAGTTARVILPLLPDSA